MAELNPYAAPANAIELQVRHAQRRDGRARIAWVALSLAAVVPLLFMWERAAEIRILPRLPLPHPNVLVDVGIWIAILLLTMSSVPLGFLGTRSRRVVVAAAAIVLGAAMTGWILRVKFYPVLWHF